MHPHHTRSIGNGKEYFRRDPEVPALLPGGSTAHGFETDENELLHPYHRWFLRVLEGAKDKPVDLEANVHALNESATLEDIESFYGSVHGFQPWVEGGFSGPAQFMFDSNLNRVDGKTPVGDL